MSEKVVEEGLITVVMLRAINCCKFGLILVKVICRILTLLISVFLGGWGNDTSEW